MEDVEYLRLLRDAVAAGVIKPSLNLNKLEHVDSPISVQADSNRWIYSLIVIVSAAAWLGGTWWAVGAAGAGGAAWFTIGKRWHRQRMERRFYELSLDRTDEWKKLWRMTGVTLIDPKTGTECASPAGNWRAFVARVTGQANGQQTAAPSESPPQAHPV